MLESHNDTEEEPGSIDQENNTSEPESDLETSFGGKRYSMIE